MLDPNEAQWLTVSDLYERGWTDPIIKRLPAPTRGTNPHHKSSPKAVRRWSLEDVMRLENRPDIRAQLERVAGRRAGRAERRRAQELQRQNRAFLGGLALEQAFDAQALETMTEGDHTAILLVRRLHQAILSALYDTQPVRSIAEAQDGLRTVVELTGADVRHSRYLKNPQLLASCAPWFGRGETKRERSLHNLLQKGYTASLVRVAAVILYEYAQRGEPVPAEQILALSDFPVRKLMDSSLYQIYLVDFIPAMIRSQLSDLITVDPKDEYPEARMMQRRFVIHVGGTNTGKTYESLNRLAQAESGVYLAPLRLLALEVQESMLERGVNCSMLTGEEEDIRPGAMHIASTVEKLDPHRVYDVAVVDECQMIADRERGFAWTRAILGCCAREIHLCTAPEGLDIIVRLIESCGEPYEIEHHGRKCDLILVDQPITLDDVQDGDAFIAFSKRNVLLLAEQLRQIGVPASIIYGALPYATRKLQMERFLRGETRVLVATDAIGMGLNLPIRRVIFTRDRKFDGLHNRALRPEEIRQIGGRAGRFGVYDEGFVTATIDSETIWQGFSAPVEPIKQAMLGFSDLVLRVDHDLLEVLQVWNSIPAIEPYKKMPIDRYIFILKTLQDCGLALDKEQSLRAATIPFDEREEELMDYFLLYCGQYLEGREIEWPRRGKSSLDGLELYSQMLDLYYSFCRAFRQPVDLDWLRTEKENTALQINELLVRELSQKGKSCQVCHAPMPLSSKFRVCYKCMMKRKKQNHIQMHGRKSG